MDMDKLIEALELGEDDRLKLESRARDNIITTEQLCELLEEKKRKRILEEEHKARQRRWHETQLKTNKAVTISNMCDMPSRIIPIDIDLIRNSTLFGEHRVFELLNHMQFALERIAPVVTEGKIDQSYVAQCDNLRKSIEKLRRILALHFDVLRSVENVTRRVLPDSEATIYATILDAINSVASIMDEKEIDIDIDSLKGKSIRHNKKFMTETITRLLGVLAQAAKEQSGIQIAMGSEGANQYLDTVCSESYISVNDWINLLELAEGKDSWHPGIKKIDDYEEIVLTLRLVLLRLARQMLRLEIFAGQDNHCVFRIIADSDV